MKKIVNLLKNLYEILSILWSSSKVMTILLIFNNISRHAIWPLRAFIVRNIVNIISLSIKNGFNLYKADFIVNISLFFLFFWLNRIWWPLNSYTQTLMLAKIGYETKIRIIQVMENTKLSFFDKPENYDIYNQALEQTKGRQPIDTVNQILSLFSLITSFIAAFSIMVVIDIKAALLLVISSVPSLIWEDRFNKKLYDFSQNTVRERRLLQYIFELFTNKTSAKEIRVFQTSDYLINKHSHTLDEYNTQYLKHAKAKIRVESIFWTILQISLMSSYFIIISKVNNNSISIGDLSYFLSIALNLQMAFKNMGMIMNNIINFNRYISNLLRFEEMNTKEDHTDFIPLPDTVQRIEFNNVSFSYPNSDKEVLKQLSFKIDAPAKIIILGENGSGKSTLLKLLLGFYQPTEGEILLNRIPINRYNIDEYHQLFSVCFQDYIKYGFTLRDNIVMANSSITDEMLNSILRRVELDDVVNQLAKKEHTYLSREYDLEGTELSGGQYNKIAIARALAKNTQIVLLDEPNASLDAKAERNMFNLYEELCRDKIGIMVTHRLSTAVSADLILVIKEGRIIEKGQHIDLLLLGGEYAKLFQMQSKQYVKVGV